jgi:hypothetical protein
MIKNDYLILIFFSFLICASFLYKKNTQIHKPELLDISKLNQKISDNINNIDFNKDLITSYNIKKNNINSIYYENISSTINGININSELIYEKPLNFRMISKSIFGIETDVGSNDNFFWFWSKRIENKPLYYSDHKNLKKTYLRTIFNPSWMSEILGINEITSGKLLSYNTNYLANIQEDVNNTGRKIIKVKLIDLHKNALFGSYIYNMYDEIMISAEIVEYHLIEDNYYPKKIVINWFEENIQMNWNMSIPKINQKFNKNNFLIPNIKNKIDLKDYKLR